MKFTGERVVPGQVEADLLNEHLARYHFARQFVKGKRVLDAACGSGYGTAMLAESASSVIGIDISREAVGYARSNYAAAAAAGAEIDFSEGDCLALPFTDESLDVVVAFEIVEHLKDATGFLRELRRVLRPGGLLLLSTPNRLYYTEDRGEVNPFHEREYTFAEMDALIAPFFAHRQIIFENHVDGFAISGPGAELSHSATPAATLLTDNSAGAATAGTIAERGRDAYFFIAVCSATPIPPFSPMLFVPSTGNVLRERELHIHKLESQLDGAISDRDLAREQFQRMEQELNDFRAFFTKREAELDQSLAERTAWAQSLEQETGRARDAHARLEEEFTRLRGEFDERTAWALRLNVDVEERTAWARRLDGELGEARTDLQKIYSSRWYRIGKKLGLAPFPPETRSGDGT
ncbi:MAG: methyltransferase domain-containing protein [Acidobacteria bacterium]|nr:methyltransferase domain-containing protein [Acidobacteriota bacterium]